MNTLDAIVMGSYVALVVAVGLLAGRRHETAGDWLLGSRQLPVTLVLLSMVATELSAATFLGVPHAAFVGDWSYLQFALGAMLGKMLVASVAIPLYRRLGLVTVYGLLEDRFGPRARRAAAACFVVGRILASGVRLFIAALALSVVTETDLWLSVTLCGVAAGGYTLFGGIRSVIWTDALQAFVFLAGAFAVLWIASAAHPDGLGGILEWAAAGQRTQILHPRPFFSLSDARALGVGIIGGFFLTLATHGTDHDMVQRLLTTRRARGGSIALVGSALLNFPLTALFLCVGTALAWYAAHHLGFSPEDPSRIVPWFAMHVLPAGLRGLVFAGILAAAMSSLDSAICAISATWVVDVRPKPAAGERDTARRSRMTSVGVTVALVVAAMGMDAYRKGLEPGGGAFSLVDLALSAMTILYGGLLGVFAVAVASPRRRGDRGALAGLAMGACVGITLFLHPLATGSAVIAWPWWIPIASTAAAVTTLVAGDRRARSRTEGSEIS